MERRKVAVWKVPAPDFHVVRLQQHAALGGPVLLQREDQVLEGGRAAAPIFGVAMSVARVYRHAESARSISASRPGAGACRPVQVRLLPRR